MSARDRLCGVLGLALLVALWLGPLPALARGSYAAQMILHMGVVAVAVPVLAVGLAPLARGVAVSWPAVLGATTLIDLAVVWTWHAPALHAASRASPGVMALEQGSFAVAALLVWVPALAGPALAGALALFMTAMHMTLLGVLIALAPRTVQGHGMADQAGLWGLDPLCDQQLGGIVMTGAAGAVYVACGLTLAARALRRPAAA